MIQNIISLRKRLLFLYFF